MTQVIVNDTRPASRKVLTTKLYGAATHAVKIQTFGDVEIEGPGWITGVSLLGAGAGTIVTLYDGDDANAMPLIDIQPRTVVNMNIELPHSNWRKFDDGVFLGAVLASGSRLFIHYYQGE